MTSVTGKARRPGPHDPKGGKVEGMRSKVAGGGGHIADHSFAVSSLRLSTVQSIGLCGHHQGAVGWRFRPVDIGVVLQQQEVEVTH